jgi:dUTP pyrophosphatase
MFSRKPKITFYLPGDSDLVVPTKAYSNDLGWDFKSPQDLNVAPHQSILVNTTVKLKLPKSYGMFLKTRSSMAKKGISVEGGVIDNGYRGFICVLLRNHTEETYEIKAGDKIAQGVLVPLPNVKVEYIDGYPEEPEGGGRGEAGFGSSGV